MFIGKVNVTREIGKFSRFVFEIQFIGSDGVRTEFFITRSLVIGRRKRSAVFLPFEQTRRELHKGLNEDRRVFITNLRRDRNKTLILRVDVLLLGQLRAVRIVQFPSDIASRDVAIDIVQGNLTERGRRDENRVGAMSVTFTYFFRSR